jgi:hypothetical protein
MSVINVVIVFVMKMPNTNLFATEQEKNPGPNEEFSLKKN